MTPSLSSIGNWLVDNWKIAVIGVLVAAFAVQCARLEATERQLGQERLAHENSLAKLDSTTEELQELDSRYRFFRKLSQQYKIERDSIDERLEQESRARAQLAVQVRELRADSATADTVYAEGDMRVAEFSQRLEHGLFSTRVEVPPPPEEPRLTDLRFQLDPITLEARIGCVEKENVQAANLTVRSPDWASVTIQDVVTEPDVCNPDIMADANATSVWPVTTAIGAASGATSGYLLGNQTTGDAVVGGVLGAGTGYLSGQIWELFR